MATTDPPATATATADGNPWDEIEQKFRAQGEELRQQVLKNYNAQSELLRRLQELRHDYEAMQAALDGLDGDLERIRREKAREGQEEGEGEGAPVAANELMDGEAHVNGREEGQQQAFSVEVQEETEGIVTGGDDGSAVNLIWSTDDEQPYRQLSVEDSEEDVLDAQTPANQLDEEAQPPQPPSDLEKLPNGHHQDGEEQDQPADDNEEPTDAGTSVHSHEQATEPTELPKMNRDKKIKTITTGQSQAGGSGSSSEREPWSSFRKPPKIILSSSFTPSAAAAAAAAAAASSSDKQTLDSALEHDGYTSSDSVSHDQLHFNDWRLHQVRTRTFATNPLVTQYWHWVTETKEKENSKEIEHQVLEGVEPPRWAVFKKPYNFHLKLDDIQEVKFAAAGRGR